MLLTILTLSTSESTLMATLHSRTSTIVASLQRLDATSSKYNGEQEFRLHVIGSDEMEVACFASTDGTLSINSYNDVFSQVLLRGFSSLQLLFIGPNMPPTALNTSSTFVYKDDSSITELKVELSFKADTYHEFWAKALESQVLAPSVPHLVVLFNPGLWGYASWLPTLRLFLTDEAFLSPKYMNDRQPPVYYVITSYTWEESEVDYDAVFDFYAQIKGGEPDVAASKYSLKWVWDCEVNENRSTEPCSVVRKTCAPGTVYYDNYAWQCICMEEV